MGMQVRDYIVARSSHPSGAWMPLQGRGWIPDLSPVTPTQMMGPRLTRDAWDLDDDQLQEVLEALQMETARREGSTPTWVILGQSEGPWGWQ